MARHDPRLERTRGYRGGVIARHRSLTHFEYEGIVVDGFLALGLLFAWIALLPDVMRLWAWLLGQLGDLLSLPAVIGDSVLRVGPKIALHVPYLDISAGNPRVKDILLAAGLAAGAFAVGRALPLRFMPLRLLLYLVGFVHATAVVFFSIRPTGIDRDLASYLETMMLGGLFLVSLVPLLFAFTYYILEPSIVRKAMYTILCMAHLTVFIPVQYALHAFLVHHGSLVMLPTLYMLFGLFLDVFVVVAFYALAVAAIREAPAGRPR